MTFSDANGAADIAGVGALINSSLNGVNACWFYYDRSSDTINLANDSTSAWTATGAHLIESGENDSRNVDSSPVHLFQNLKSAETRLAHIENQARWALVFRQAPDNGFARFGALHVESS